jgi:kinesin family protein 23
VNPSNEEYEETLHVMKFAEVTQEVMVSRPEMYQIQTNIRKQTGRGLYDVAAGLKQMINYSAVGTIGPPLPTLLFSDDPNDPNNEKVIPEWLECLELRRKNAKRKDDEIHQKNAIFRQELAKLEDSHMNLEKLNERLQKDLEAREHQVRQMESQLGQKDRVNDAKEKRQLSLEKKLKQVERELNETKQTVVVLENEKRNLIEKYEYKIQSEQTRIRRLYEKEMAEKAAKLNREKCINEEKIQMVHEILCTEGANWNQLIEREAAPNYRASTSTPPSANTVTAASGSSGLPGKETASASSPDKYRTKSTSTQPKTQKSPYKQIRSDFDLIRSLASPRNDMVFDDEATEGVDRGLPPVSNPRHRRSLSTGNEKWIDHRPPGTLDLGTVFQPKFKNKTSMSNLKNVHAKDLKDASKYALTHHTADANGEVETHVYKGEVIPSVGGGAQVIFNDVETLHQGSPPGRKRAGSEGRVLGGLTPSTTLSNEAEQLGSPYTKRSRRHLD